MIKMPFEIFSLFYDLLDFFTIVICFNDLYFCIRYLPWFGIVIDWIDRHTFYSGMSLMIFGIAKIRHSRYKTTYNRELL